MKEKTIDPLEHVPEVMVLIRHAYDQGRAELIEEIKEWVHSKWFDADMISIEDVERYLDSLNNQNETIT